MYYSLHFSDGIKKDSSVNSIFSVFSLFVCFLFCFFQFKLKESQSHFRNKNRQKLPGLVNRLISQADRPVTTLFQGPPLTNQ